jgi:hypothetical protein
MNKAIKIAKQINEIASVNVFANTRKKEVVEARSLLGFILKNYEKMTLYQIRDFYIKNGKKMNHATIIHSIKNFEVFKNYEPQLIDWLNIISKNTISFNYERKKELIKLKLNYISNKNINKLLLIIDKMVKKELKK